MRLYWALNLPITTYASETLALTAADEKKLLIFEIQCLRSVLGVSRLNRIRNIEIRRATGTEKTIVDVIKDKKLKCFDHLSREPIDLHLYANYINKISLIQDLEE